MKEKTCSHRRMHPASCGKALLKRSMVMASATAMLAGVLTVSAATLTWDVAGPTDTWTPTTGNANWNNGVTDIEWTDGNGAQFTNAMGEAITITGTVSPASVAVGANNGSWSFIGSGAIGGSSTLTKSGTGTLTITIANSYSGGTTINGGILSISNSAALGNTTGTITADGAASLQLQGDIKVAGKTITLTTANAGGTLENLVGNNEWAGTVNMNVNKSSNVKVTAGTLTLSGTVALTGGGASASLVNNGTGLLISGTLTGVGMGFTASGTGLITISGTNTFGDGAHGLGVGGSSTVQISDSTTYAAGDQTITHNGLGAGLVTFSANTGSGSILQLRANGQNDATAQRLTYTNDVTVYGASGVNGTINVDRQGGTGVGKILVLGNLTTGPNSGTLNVSGSNGYNLAVRTVIITGGSKSAVVNPTTANLIIASVTNTGTTLSTLILNGTSASNSVTGTIGNGSAPTAVTKGSAAGNTSTWALNGKSSYSGPTAVNYGTLLVNGDQTQATGAVTVASSATLGGTGIVGGATSVSSGGKLSPGNTAGKLTFNAGLTLAGGVGSAGATAIFEAGDLVAVTGALNLASGWNLTVTGTGFRNGGSVTLFSYTTAGTISTNADINSGGLDFTPSGSLFLTDTGSSIVLHGISSTVGIPKGTLVLVK